MNREQNRGEEEQHDRKAFANDMSEEETTERADRNETFEIDGLIQGNRTGDLPEFFNVTPLDVNATNEIDSFYFYEVS